MKKITLFLSAITLVLAFNACDELTDLLSITFDNVKIEKTVNVTNFTDEAAQKSIKTNAITGDEIQYVSFNEVDTINLKSADNGDSKDNLSEYLNQLTSVSIDSTEFIIPAIYGEYSIENMEVKTITITLKADNGLNYSETLTNVVPGVSFALKNFSNEIKSDLSEAFAENMNITYTISGTVSGDTKGFSVIMKVIANIKASPLAKE